jgi:hypothetical protein
MSSGGLNNVKGLEIFPASFLFCKPQPDSLFNKPRHIFYF